MTLTTFFSTDMLVAYSAYFIGTASPGPSNLAIMSIATTHGRKSAYAFSLGVMSGSIFWALLATLGVSAALLAWSSFLVAIKLFGGCYLLWLAYKSGRSAVLHKSVAVAGEQQREPLRRLYTRGVLLHLTNPKAVLVWISIAALASSSEAGGAHPVAVVPGCAAIGMLVFGGYATLFSTESARRVYARTRRAMEACLAGVFGVAGIKLLASR